MYAETDLRPGRCVVPQPGPPNVTDAVTLACEVLRDSACSTLCERVDSVQVDMGAVTDDSDFGVTRKNDRFAMITGYNASQTTNIDSGDVLLI